MNKKVRELMEKTEVKIREWIIANYPIGTQDFSDLTKQIFSDPDLVLIDKRFLWTIKAILTGMQIKQQDDRTITWRTNLDAALEEFDDMIILWQKN